VRIFLAAGLSSALLLALTTKVRAETPRLHVSGGVAHAVGSPQSSELSWGAAGNLALELPLGKMFGVQAELGALALGSGDAPADKTLAPRSSATALTGMLGFRVQPFYSGIWLDLNAGLGSTGGNNRFAFDAHVGYDFVAGRARAWQVGPVLGYVQLVQPDDTLRPEDGRVLWLGVHVAYGKRPADGCSDRDHDNVCDEDDACPDVEGFPTINPKTTGCPHLAPVAVVTPPPPLVVRSDRDKDAVFDDEDACPDVPGIRTADAKTNGCPVPSESVRVEGALIILDDIIHFELDSSRIHHGSWNAVKKVAMFILATPDLLEINIEGHADETGSTEHNLILSAARSESVKQLLVHFGVQADRLTTQAFGEDRPRAAGHTEVELRENRRVEFTVVRSRESRGASK
jgi:OmpA-OmpF porin, OOP family